MSQNKPSSFRKNLKIQGAKDVLSMVILFGLTAVITRTLGAEKLGELAWAETIVLMLSNFGDLGLSRAMMVFVSKARGRGEPNDNPEIRSALWARMGFIALLLVCGGAFAGWESFHNWLELEFFDADLFRMALVAAAFALCERHINPILTGLERFDWLAISKLCSLSAYAGILGTLWGTGTMSPETIMFAIMARGATGALCGGGFLLIKQRYRLFGMPTVSGFKALSSVSGWTMVSVVSITLFQRLDTLMLASMVGSTSVGIYNVGQKSTQMLHKAMGSFMNVLFPKIAAMDDPDEIARLLRLIFRRSLYLTLGLLPFYALSPYWVVLYFGEEFAPSVFIFQVLFIRFLTQLFVSHFGHVFYAFNKPWILSVTNICQAIANFGGNLWLIPLYGEAGAALATLLTAVPALILFTWGLRWTLNGARAERAAQKLAQDSAQDEASP